MFLCVFCRFKNDVSFNIGNIQNIVVFERYRLEIASVLVLLFSLRLFGENEKRYQIEIELYCDFELLQRYW